MSEKSVESKQKWDFLDSIEKSSKMMNGKEREIEKIRTLWKFKKN